MNESSTNAKLDALLEHGGWVRALAQSLVADSAAAEDIEQKTWLAAVERPPKHTHNPKAWLGSVVRNLAGMHWRESSARRRRERVVAERRGEHEARSSKSQQPDGLGERVETFQILATALGSLAEPYGTTLYLRFFEELTMRQISKRLSVPESTVQARITRGLEMLRQQLESTLGDDWRAQCLVFTVPLAAAPAAAIPTALVMTLNTKLLISAALVAVASLLYSQPWSPSEDALATADTTMVITGVLAGTTSEPLQVGDAGEEQILRSTIDYKGKPMIEEPESEPIATVRFQVVEEGSKQPLPGVGMSVGVPNLGKQQGVTDRAGHWSVEVPTGHTRVELDLSLQEDRQDFRFTEDVGLSAGERAERTITVPRQYSYRCIIQTPDGVPYANGNVEIQNYVPETKYHSTTAYVTSSQGVIDFPYLPGRVNDQPPKAIPHSMLVPGVEQVVPE